VARNERSAGIVVFANDPVRGRVYLLLDYGKHWDYAKGHVHKNESDRDAALRELEEETGLRDVRFVDGFEHEMTYFFRGGKTLIKKTVIFFLAETDRQDVTLSHEHVGYAFLPYAEALDRVTFAKAKDLLRQAESHLAPL
jgi:8-oxo-dGTP pyrophosphatase MutT (NUDIX family)